MQRWCGWYIARGQRLLVTRGMNSKHCAWRGGCFQLTNWWLITSVNLIHFQITVPKGWGSYINICVCVQCVYVCMYMHVWIGIYIFIYTHILLINKDEDRMSMIKDCTLHLVLQYWNILQEWGSISVWVVLLLTSEELSFLGWWSTGDQDFFSSISRRCELCLFFTNFHATELRQASGKLISSIVKLWLVPGNICWI